MPNGIIVIDKPQDWTSMDVCAKLRGIFHEKRVGHAGTLDPMATGVLPIFVGRATRAVQFAEAGEKEYLAGLELGLTTNTQDIWGEPLETRTVPADAGERLQALLPRFTGEIDQIPPMFSAIKLHGKKLYELARKGVEVERKPRRITIYALTLEGRSPEGSWLLRVRCSKGTYIRTLCHDLGQALGCGGCMSSLRRTRAAGFTLDQSVTLESLQAAEHPEALLQPVDDFFAQTGWPGRVVVPPAAEQRLRSGGQATVPAAEGEFRVYSETGEFLGLGRAEASRLRLIKGFFEV